MKVRTESGSLYELDLEAKTVYLPDGRVKTFEGITEPELGKSLFISYPSGSWRRTSPVVEVDG